MSLSTNAAKLKLWLDRYKMTATELTARIGTGPGKIRGSFGLYLAEVAATDLAAPGTFTATPYDGNVHLAWADIAGESNYKLERSPNADFVPDTVVTTSIAANATSYTDTGLTALTGYHYRIHGTVAGKDAGHKTLYTITVAALAASASLVASLITDTTLTLTWAVVASATGYVVERATNAGFTADLSTIYTGVLLTVNETGLTAGNTYYYRVHATLANYTIVTYTTVVTTLATALIAPAAPTAASIAQTTLTLNWVKTAGATGYIVKRSATAGGSYVTVTGGTVGDVATLAVTGLTADTDNYFEVTATKSGFASKTSVASANFHTTA